MSRWDRIQGLTEAQRRILGVLLEHEVTGASAEELRRVTGYSLSTTVIRALEDLRRQGLVRVVAVHREPRFRAESHIWALTPKGVRALYLIRRDGPRKKQTRWPSRRAAAARKRLAAEGRPFGSDQYV